MADDEIMAAALWVVENWEAAVERSLIGAVRERFGVDVGTAAKVVAAANRIKAGVDG